MRLSLRIVSKWYPSNIGPVKSPLNVDYQQLLLATQGRLDVVAHGVARFDRRLCFEFELAARAWAT
jgi:hypothetical protein